MIGNLNSSQKECIQKHSRSVRNGINLIHGPFGSEMTVLVAALCKLQTARLPESTTFIACDSNSACDGVVPKFANSKLMIVRAHYYHLNERLSSKPIMQNSALASFARLTHYLRIPSYLFGVRNHRCLPA